MADIERWITVNGQHIPIMKGENVAQALGNHFKNKRNKAAYDKMYKAQEEFMGRKLTDKEKQQLKDVTRVKGVRSVYNNDKTVITGRVKTSMEVNHENGKELVKLRKELNRKVSDYAKKHNVSLEEAKDEVYWNGGMREKFQAANAKYENDYRRARDTEGKYFNTRYTRAPSIKGEDGKWYSVVRNDKTGNIEKKYETYTPKKFKLKEQISRNEYEAAKERLNNRKDKEYYTSGQYDKDMNVYSGVKRGVSKVSNDFRDTLKHIKEVNEFYEKRSPREKELVNEYSKLAKQQAIAKREAKTSGDYSKYSEITKKMNDIYETTNKEGPKSTAKLDSARRKYRNYVEEKRKITGLNRDEFKRVKEAEKRADRMEEAYRETVRRGGARYDKRVAKAYMDEYDKAVKDLAPKVYTRDYFKPYIDKEMKDLSKESYDTVKHIASNYGINTRKSDHFKAPTKKDLMGKIAYNRAKEKAYKQYMKDHPNSKMKFEDFERKY